MTDLDRISILEAERDLLMKERDTFKDQIDELLTILDQVTSLLARKKKAQGQPTIEG